MKSGHYGDGARNHRIVIMPNASLPAPAAWLFFSVTAVVLATIAVLFWLRGAWLIAPFAGLELAALGAALIWCQRRNRYREVLSIEDDLVRLESGYGVPQQCKEFQRPWLQVRMRRSKSRLQPSRLMLVSHGRALELGACLTEAERRQLAARLREVL